MKSTIANRLVPTHRSPILMSSSSIFIIAFATNFITLPAAETPPASPLVHFTFNGHARNIGTSKVDIELRDTEIKDDALVLNGIYEHGPVKGGSHAVCATPDFQYTAFTVLMLFKADEFTPEKSTLLVAGPGYRWFGLQRSDAGNLTVTFNNAGFQREIKNAPVKAGRWTVVACGVDLAARLIVTYLGGQKVAEFPLPKDFKLDVIGTPAEKSDKAWLFVNYSNTNLFHGQIDELIIYNRLLSAEEFRNTFQDIPHPRSAEDDKPAPPDSNLESLTKLEQEVFELTNRERGKVGLPPYKINKVLMGLARGHVANMARQEILNHTLDDKSFFDRMKAANYDHFAAGENIQVGTSAAEAVAHWMESPGHKANILSKEFTEIGIGMSKSKSDDTYWTQVFGAPVISRQPASSKSANGK